MENVPGGDFGGDSKPATGHEMADLANLEKMKEVTKICENCGFLRGKIGGGGRSRTYDAADMSRVL